MLRINPPHNSGRWQPRLLGKKLAGGVIGPGKVAYHRTRYLQHHCSTSRAFAVIAPPRLVIFKGIHKEQGPRTHDERLWSINIKS